MSPTTSIMLVGVWRNSLLQAVHVTHALCTLNACGMQRPAAGSHCVVLPDMTCDSLTDTAAACAQQY